MFDPSRRGKSSVRSRPRLLLEELEPRTLLSASALDNVVATPQLLVLAPQASALDSPQARGSGSGVTNPTPPPGAYTPSQLQAAYGFNQISGIDYTGKTGPLPGAGQTIAIVDAYNAPHIATDLAAFDKQYGLAAPPSLTVINQNGAVLSQNGKSTSVRPPPIDATGGWELEESLDVEWAHAIAPGANIVLVEASSATNRNLFQAVQTAANYKGVSVVSMSWGANEWSGETAFDKDFTKAGVTYVAASGDSGAPPIYPAVSPNVLAVGGTTLPADVNGNPDLASETGWSGSGGGISAFENLPAYQVAAVANNPNIPGGTPTTRTSPDVAYNADPNTGYAIYDSSTYYPYYPFSFGHQSGWFQIGGTSAGAPQWSALIAIANQGRQTANGGTANPLNGAGQTLPAIYNMSAGDFNDITSGDNGYSAGVGYDLVTGRGTPLANKVVAALVSADSTGGVHGLAAPSDSAAPTSPASRVSLAQFAVNTGESVSASSPSSSSATVVLVGQAPFAAGSSLASLGQSTPALADSSFGFNSSLLSNIALRIAPTLTTTSGLNSTSPNAALAASVLGTPLYASRLNSAPLPSMAFRASSGQPPVADAADDSGMMESSGAAGASLAPGKQNVHFTPPQTDVPAGERREGTAARDACFADAASMGLLAEEILGPEIGDNEESAALQSSGLVLLALWASGFWKEPASATDSKERRASLPMSLKK